MLQSAYRIEICHIAGSADEMHVGFQRDCPESWASSAFLAFICEWKQLGGDISKGMILILHPANERRRYTVTP